MTMSPETLIEKFAEMVEKADQLDGKTFAEKTVDILITLSMMDGSASDIMKKINEKIHSLLAQADDIKWQGRTQHDIANQLRQLKENVHHMGFTH